MKAILALLMLLLLLSHSLPTALAQSITVEPVVATTAISLPVDSITIYPEGLVSVRRAGSMEVTEGLHQFVIDLPGIARTDSALLSVINATVVKTTYGSSTKYTLNVSRAGVQSFVLSYLMDGAATWKPRYLIQMSNSSALISADAIISNNAGEDFRNVQVKLVTGLPSTFLNQSKHGAMEVLPGRYDLEMNREIGLPLFEDAVPLQRKYTWDVSNGGYEGLVYEVIVANNTMHQPWPGGRAQLYMGGEYVSTVDMPYTPNGTNASLSLGESSDISVEKKLKDYNVSERVDIQGPAGSLNGSLKVTVENSTYQIRIESNDDRYAILELRDVRPKEAEILKASPKPSEVTASDMRWNLTLKPRQKTAVEYTYRIVRKEAMKPSGEV